jgi:hypothetical protein
VLAICGWKLSQAAAKPSLQCSFCGRVVAIEKFANIEQHQQKIINDRMLQPNEKGFDLIE